MAKSIIMPKTGMAMEEGTLLEWFIKEGDRVEKGDPVAEIETDKATMELESDYDGVILALLRDAGDTVPVTEVIAWVGEPGEAIPQGSPPEVPAGSESAEQEPAKVSGRVKATPAARKAGKEKNVSLQSVLPSGKHGEVLKKDVISAGTGDPPVRVTPLARRIAGDRGISLEEVKGSGHGGKIFSADLPDGPAASGEMSVDVRVPLTSIQKTTGRRMAESCRTIPSVTEHTRADVTDMLLFREQLKECAGQINITVNDIVLKAVIQALGDHPRMNSVLDGNDLIYRGNINIGMAVATPRGLLVPVIHEAQNLSLTRLAARTRVLIAGAREGALSAEEMGGGTFTVTNVGMFGITSFTPIINPPEAGIMGVCSIEDELKLEAGNVTVRKLMGLSLTFDHRIVDGSEASMFLKRVREYLEAPLMMLI